MHCLSRPFDNRPDKATALSGETGEFIFIGIFHMRLVASEVS